MELLYSGIDTLDLACQGAMDPTALNELRLLQLEAQSSKKPIAIQLGSNAATYFLQPGGRRGGYKFILKQGPCDPVICIKDNILRTEWNFFIDMGAACCLSIPINKLIDRAKSKLNDIGAFIAAIHVNRVDVCFDFLVDDFDLHAQNFVTPSRMKTFANGMLPKRDPLGIDTATSVGGSFQSVTCGRQPGRQVIVYDKWREIVDRGKLFWLKVWDRPTAELENNVWRIECRAGSKALAQLVPVKTSEAVIAALPAFLEDTLKRIRYVSDRDSSSNTTRLSDHPLWAAAKEASQYVMEARDAAILTEQVKKCLLDRRQKMAIEQSIGNAVTAYSIASPEDEISADRLVEDFSHRVSETERRRGEGYILIKQKKCLERLESLLPEKKAAV